MNFHWPKKRGNNYAPWYVILWRCVWWLPIMVSFSLAFIFITFASGIGTAREFWKDAI